MTKLSTFTNIGEIYRSNRNAPCRILRLIMEPKTPPPLSTLSLIGLSENNYWRKNRTRFEVRQHNSIKRNLTASLYAEYLKIVEIFLDVAKALKRYILHLSHRQAIYPAYIALYVKNETLHYKKINLLKRIVSHIYQGNQCCIEWLNDWTK
jgi:hypothetical protein